MQALQSQGIIRYNMIAAGIMNIGTVALCALLSQDSVLGFEGVTRDRTSPPLWRGSFFVALYHPDFAHRYPFFFLLLLVLFFFNSLFLRRLQQ